MCVYACTWIYVWIRDCLNAYMPTNSVRLKNNTSKNVRDCVCICMYIWICMHVCMCVCAWLYVCRCTYVYVYACMYVSVWPYKYVYMYVCMRAWLCVCLYTNMTCVCMYTCVCMCVHMWQMNNLNSFGKITRGVNVCSSLRAYEYYGWMWLWLCADECGYASSCMCVFCMTDGVSCL